MNEWKNNLYNTFYWLQHVYKQMQVDITGELHFGKVRVPDWTSVPLSEDMNLEQFEHCIVLVLIQPSVQ